MNALVPGTRILRRYFSGTTLVTLFDHTVLDCGSDRLILAMPIGTPYWRIVSPTGRFQHEDPFGVLEAGATLEPQRWSGVHATVWMSRDAPYALYTFWEPTGEFRSFYGNLQAPMRLGQLADGTVVADTSDHAADLVFPNLEEHHWKDLDELVHRTGHPAYWSEGEAAGILAAGEALVDCQRRRVSPFPREIPAMPPMNARAVLPLSPLPGGWSAPMSV